MVGSYSYFLYVYMVLLTLFSHYFIEKFQSYFRCSKLKLIILNSYEHFNRIELNSQLNPVESNITHCSLDSSVSYQNGFTFKFFCSIQNLTLDMYNPEYNLSIYLGEIQGRRTTNSNHSLFGV